MSVPSTIDPAKQYSIRIGRPVELPDGGGTLLPSHDEILVSGAILKKIKDKVLEANERPTD